MALRVYLAGPDVFLPDPIDWAEQRKAICRHHGLHAISPLDALTSEPSNWAALPEWRRIALRNEAHIRSVTAVIANLTPFRGPSADVGTVYEIGYARALGRRIFAYANCTRLFHERSLAFSAVPHGDRDQEGLQIEQFGCFDNLMIEAGLLGSGGTLLLPAAEPPDRWRDLTTFERCVEHVAKTLTGDSA